MTPNRKQKDPTNLVHLPDQSIDLLLPVTKVTTLDEMVELSLVPSASRVAEFEWPEEVGSLLEVGANGENLVDKIFNTDDTVFAEVLLNQGVVVKSDTGLVDLSITTLVNELTNRLEVWLSVGDVWLDNLEHLRGGLGQTNKDTIVDLEKTEELEDLSRLGCNLVDTRKNIISFEYFSMETFVTYPLIRTTKASLG
jgi:hypothetical protein